jgi:uncharacterized protein (DUF433 family)
MPDPATTRIIQGTEIAESIVKTPGTCGGRARIAGHRVPVFRIAEEFRLGMAPEAMIEMWPALNLAQIHAAIAYALANLAEMDAELEAEEAAWVEAAH